MSKEIEENYKDSFEDKKNIPVGRRPEVVTTTVEQITKELAILPLGREGMVYLWRSL